MAKIRVTQRYTEILADADLTSASATPEPSQERRGAPRVPVTCGEVSVNLTFPATTVDVSTSGACFLTEQPFAVGSQITLTVATVFSLTATVVACDMEETDAMFLETRYRVRCHFVDDNQGMEVLVLAKEHERIG